MNVEELLDQIDEMLEKCMKLPGGRAIVEVERLRNIADDVRLNIPAEVKQARGIVSDRADIINTAKREADNIIRAAEERAKAMVAQEEITRMAQDKNLPVESKIFNHGGRHHKK